LVRKGCTKIVLYLWYPVFHKALQLVRYDVSCYHIDDEYSYSTEDRPVEPREAALLGAVDQVFITSPAMFEKKGHLNPASIQLPHGVDYTAYATARPEPDDLARIPHPRIGYTGNLKRQLDWSLIEGLAARHPSYSFVFVGPEVSLHPEVATAVARLRRFGNVHFLGAKTVEDLASYPQHFDVCVMPYQVDNYTNYIYPLKLHEFLASGRPVVGSPIRTLREYAGLIGVADGVEGWSRALAEALIPEDSETVARRLRVAAAHDWSTLIGRLAGAIARRLGPEIEQRVVAASPPIDDTVLSQEGALETVPTGRSAA
jgi:glycosyltransferase involved in cell wall biosynthesis